MSVVTSPSALPVPEATVPVRGEGRPTPWWGMVCLIMTESTLFAGLIGSYFFLRASSKVWPPPGIEARVPLKAVHPAPSSSKAADPPRRRLRPPSGTGSPHQPA